MKFEPDPNCKYCLGVGERKTAHPKFPMYPCICVFVEPPVAGVCQEALNRIAHTEGTKD